MKLQAARIRALAQHLSKVEALLSDAALRETFSARSEWLRKQEEAERLRAATFPDTVLAGTGSDAWKAMWRAARVLSEEHAYPTQPFPVVDDGTRCLLCQQGIDHDAAHRLTQFEAFVASTTERELGECLVAFDARRRALLELSVSTDATAETVKELRIEHEDLASAVDAAMASLEARRKTAADALERHAPLPEDVQTFLTIQARVTAMADQVDDRIRALSGDIGADKKKILQAEAQELARESAYSSDREQVFHAMVNGAWRGRLEMMFLLQVFTMRQANVGAFV